MQVLGVHCICGPGTCGRSCLSSFACCVHCHCIWGPKLVSRCDRFHLDQSYMGPCGLPEGSASVWPRWGRLACCLAALLMLVCAPCPLRRWVDASLCALSTCAATFSIRCWCCCWSRWIFMHSMFQLQSVCRSSVVTCSASWSSSFICRAYACMS